jgi:hypothetical protein
MKKEKGAKIFVLSTILILSLSLASAGWFSDLFKTNKVVYTGDVGRGISGPIPSGTTITFTDPKSSAVYILHYNSLGTNYASDANNYCKLVMGCTGYSSATVVADSAFACRCEGSAANQFKCPGVSCTPKNSTSAGNCSCTKATGSWSRFSSITCTGCSTSSSCTGTNNFTCPTTGSASGAAASAVNAMLNFMCTSVSPYKDYCKVVNGKCVQKSCSEIPASVCNVTHGGCARTTTITEPSGNQKRIGGDPNAPGGWDPSKPWPTKKDCTLANCDDFNIIK